MGAICLSGSLLSRRPLLCGFLCRSLVGDAFALCGSTSLCLLCAAALGSSVSLEDGRGFFGSGCSFRLTG